MWFIKVMKNGFNFKDRARRKEYWCFMLATLIFSIVLTLLNFTLFNNLISIGELTPIDYLLMLFNLIIIIPSLSLTTRRLHDINKSGWWQLIYLIPIIGLFVMLYFLVQRGDKFENIYGLDPIE